MSPRQRKPTPAPEPAPTDPGAVLWTPDLARGIPTAPLVTVGGLRLVEDGVKGTASVVPAPWSAAESALRIRMGTTATRHQFASDFSWYPQAEPVTEHWYGMRLWVEEWGGTGWCDQVAWRRDGSNGYANTDVHSGYLWLRRNTTRAAEYRDGLGLDLMRLAPWAKGSQLDLVFRFRWSMDPAKALREAWVNGVQVGRQTTQNLLEYGIRNRLRIGLYQASGQPVRQVVYGRVVLGTSYAAVDPAA